MAGGNLVWELCEMAQYHDGKCEKNFCQYDETQKGHMRKQHQSVHHTMKVCNSETKPLTNDNVPALDSGLYINVYTPWETIYTNKMGQFPAMSNKGNQFIMVMSELDNNFIDMETMKDRFAGSLCKA